MKAQIQLYFHCKKCMSGALAVGYTTNGIQVWCDDCDKEVISLDLTKEVDSK